MMKAGFIKNLTEEERKKIKETKQEDWIAPMLAKLTHQRFSDKSWIFERKLDGERCLAFRKGKELRLLSRNKKKLNDTYPEIEKALLTERSEDYIIDGEIVAFKGRLTSFPQLQKRMHIKEPEEALSSGVSVFYYVFDILYLDGFDLRDLALTSRKALLKNELTLKEPVRYLPHKNEKGEEHFQKACEKGWEGLIAKKADNRYESKRSGEWLKFKCGNQQEFVIGGFTEPEGKRIGFGALLIGYYENDDLIYAGKVGTGYNEKTLKSLSKKLKSLEQETSSFSKRNEVSEKNARWVKPKLIAQVGYTEWTRDGKLRHPRFLGLRRDKSPEDVKKEQ